MKKFNFGENLKALRIAKGVSQDAMSMALDISQSSYSRLERRQAIPDLPSPVKIANALEMPVENLLPPADEFEIAAIVAPNSATLQIQPKAFLNTTLGSIITIGTSMYIIDAVYQATHGVCDALGTSDDTLIYAKWIAALTTMFTLIYLIWKAKKSY